MPIIRDLLPIVLSYIKQNNILLLLQISNNINKQITEYINKHEYYQFMKVVSDDSLGTACKNYYLVSIKYISIELDEGAWNWGLNGACEGGHIKLAQLMINKGEKQLVVSGVPSGLPNCWNWGLRNACYGGQMKLAQLMISKGEKQLVVSGVPNSTNDWHWGLFSACYGRQIKLAQLMISNGEKQQVISKLPSGLPNRCNYCNKSIQEHLK